MNSLPARILVLFATVSVLFALWCYFLSGKDSTGETAQPPAHAAKVKAPSTLQNGSETSAPPMDSAGPESVEDGPLPDAEDGEDESVVATVEREPYTLPKAFATVDDFIDAILLWYEYEYGTPGKELVEIEAEFMSHVQRFAAKYPDESKLRILWVGLFDKAPNERLKSVILGGWPRKGLHDLNFLHRVALDIKLDGSVAKAPRRLAIKLLVSKYGSAPETPDFLLDHMYLEANVYGRTFIFEAALETLSHLTSGAVPDRLPPGKSLVAYVHELDTMIYYERPHRKPRGSSQKASDKAEVEKAKKEMERMSLGMLLKLLAREKTPRPAKQAATEIIISKDSGIKALLKSVSNRKVPDERFIHVIRALAEAAFSDIERENIIKLIFKRFKSSRTRFQKLTILDQFWWLTRNEGHELYELAIGDDDPLVRLKARYVFAKIHEDTDSVIGDLGKLIISDLNTDELALVEGVLSRLYRNVHDRIGSAIGTTSVPRWFSYSDRDEFIEVLTEYQSLLKG